MGWRDTVQKLFRRQASGQVAALSRGASGEATMPRQIPTTPDSGMSGAYMQLATMLSVDTDLMLRFADYENMDDSETVSCLVAESPVTVLDMDGLHEVRIDELARRTEPFLVLSVDLARKRIVPAWATAARQTGTQVPVFRVTFSQHRANPGQVRKQWSIRATAEHLFMLRDGSYCPLGQLRAGDRLMPISMEHWHGYARVGDPWASSGSPVHHMVHTLVAEELIAHGPLAKGCVVHHKDENRANPHPDNLEIKRRADHVRDHGVTQRPEVQEKIRVAVTQQWKDDATRLSRSRSMRAARGGSHVEQWAAGPTPKGILTNEHRRRISESRTIPLAPDVVEAALRTSLSMNEARKKLGVSASTLARRMLAGGLSADLLGTSVQTLIAGDVGYENHTVVSVEPDGFADVYDIEVPDYHNFVCNGVVVHNCALDVYADNATVADTIHEATIWGTSKDKVIRDIINDLLDRRLHIEDEIWTAIRTLLKYGNAYAEVIANEKGVLGLNWLPAPTMRRIVDIRGTLVGFVQDPTGSFAFSLSTQEDLDRLRQQQGTNGAVFFSPWEIVHWRLRGKQMRALYGFSILDSVRWVWKRLLMLEDSSLVCKLTKAPARFAFYIDTGEIPPREARAMVDDVRRRYKKKRIMDPQTGKLDFRWNPLAQDEDIFIPTRAGKDATRVEVLSGPDYDDTGVLDYFRKKLYAGLRIPPQYLGGTEVTNRAALTQEDVQFARLEMRIQREFITGLRQVVRVHLAALNIDPDSVKWDLKMPAPSSIFEMQQVEVWNARAGLAAALQPFFTAPWIMANIFHMSDEDALFAAEAKTHEAEAQALGQASIQAEIMRQFPELGPEGALALGAPPPMAGMMAPGMQQPGQEQMPQESIKRIEKALHQLQESNDRVTRSVERTDSAVSRIGQRFRAISQTNQSRHESQAR